MRTASRASAIAASAFMIFSAWATQRADSQQAIAFPQEGAEFHIVNAAWEARLAADPGHAELVRLFADSAIGESFARWRFRPLGDGSWEIINTATGKVLDVEGGTRDKPVPVNAFTSNGSVAQRWKLQKEAQGWRIVAVVSGMALSGKGELKDRRGQAFQMPWTGKLTQVWRILPAVGAPEAARPESRFALKHGDSGLFLTVVNEKAGPVLVLEPRKPGDVQSWRFRQVEGGGGMIVSDAAGLVIGVPSGKPAPQAALGLVQPDNKPGKRWAVKREDNGGMFIVSLEGPLCVQPWEDGGRILVRLESIRRTQDQRWYAVPVEGQDGSFGPSAKPAGKASQPTQDVSGDAAAKPETAGTATAAKSQGKLASMASKKLAVAPVSTVNRDITAETLLVVQDFLIHAFVNYSQSAVLDRGSVEKLLAEYEFQTSDLADTSKAVQLGKLAGADAIVIGSLNMVGSTYYLTVKLVSVSTGEILATAIGEGEDASSFLEMCMAAVKGM
ncbi:MAG: RICIN domain-containing protein [Spirochaetes bacterium]|nr:RICIN domain-containing protein [Spirochaetota bacterium]